MLRNAVDHGLESAEERETFAAAARAYLAAEEGLPSVGGLVVHMRDVTARRRAEQELAHCAAEHAALSARIANLKAALP